MVVTGARFTVEVEPPQVTVAVLRGHVEARAALEEVETSSDGLDLELARRATD